MPSAEYGGLRVVDGSLAQRFFSKHQVRYAHESGFDPAPAARMGKIFCSACLAPLFCPHLQARGRQRQWYRHNCARVAMPPLKPNLSSAWESGHAPFKPKNVAL